MAGVVGAGEGPRCFEVVKKGAKDTDNAMKVACLAREAESVWVYAQV